MQDHDVNVPEGVYFAMIVDSLYNIYLITLLITSINHLTQNIHLKNCFIAPWQRSVTYCNKTYTESKTYSEMIYLSRQNHVFK